MSNLEWLNQQIEETKKSYDAFVLDYELFHRIGDKRDADKLKEILKHLQQIKCELEAWEEINKTFEIGVEEQTEEIYIKGKNYYGNERTIWGYSKDGVLKVKKALEVENV
jgi:hypothetical protein